MESRNKEIPMRTARVLALALLAALPVAATSYVPMTDEALVDQAPVIAVVEVQGSGSGQAGARPFTGYRVRVDKGLKGAMASGSGYLTLFPADRLQPAIGTVNFSAGQTRSNNKHQLL